MNFVCKFGNKIFELIDLDINKIVSRNNVDMFLFGPAETVESKLVFYLPMDRTIRFVLLF